MQNPLSNQEELYQQCINFVQQNILEVSQSPDSIMSLEAANDFKFVADPNSSHGIFSDLEARTVKSITAIGELGKNQMVNPYYTLTARDKAGVPTQRITTQKTKLYVLVPGSLDISDECKELLRNQFRVADEIQRAHESMLQRPTEENGIRVNDLIREGDGLSMVTTLSSEEKMWTRTYSTTPKPKDIFTKGPAAVQPLEDTLATWYDPDGVYKNVQNKNDYKLNTEMQVYDADGDLVHPSNYDKILLPGAWVAFDAHLRLWDYTRTEPQDKSPVSRTRTYHWEFTSVHVLMPPIKPVTRKRVAETSLAPAPRRAYKLPRLNQVLGRSASELFASSSSSTSPSSSPYASSSSQGTTSSTLTSPSSSTASTSHSTSKAPRKFTAKAGNTSKKGKEKETDAERMQEDL